MTENNVSAKIQATGRELTVNYEFGNNMAEAVEMFGEDVVFARFRAAATVDLQGVMRRHMQDQKGKDDTVTSVEKTDEEITEIVATWKPGLAKPKKSPADKLKDLLANMDPEARAALLASYAE
jgi:hypothetical protein